MRNKIGAVCMALGVAMLLSALSLLLWNRQESRKAAASVERLMPQLMERIQSLPTEPVPDAFDPEMTQGEIDGFAYVGYLSIPALELELPVMSQWDYARLKIAPCRYTGSTKTGNLVICAHNYDRHFGAIGHLKPGDRVAFTDMDGVVWRYSVELVETLQPTALEEMTAGEYELTLFTCTYGGAARVTVRCSALA